MLVLLPKTEVYRTYHPVSRKDVLPAGHFVFVTGVREVRNYRPKPNQPYRYTPALGYDVVKKRAVFLLEIESGGRVLRFRFDPNTATSFKGAESMVITAASRAQIERLGPSAVVKRGFLDIALPTPFRDFADVATRGWGQFVTEMFERAGL